MCQHSRAHPDWDCTPAEGHIKWDNDYESRVRLYGRDRLGDPLGEPFKIAPDVTMQLFWNAVVITNGQNCSILPDASEIWPLPRCEGECGNCQPNGTPRRTPRRL